MDVGKIITVTVSAASAVSVISSLIIASLLLNDITTFWTEQLHDLGEFKFYANDAWDELIFTNSRASLAGSSSTARAIFKRQASLPSHCACAAGPNNCPPGPRGPRGPPGRKGPDGPNGVHGKPGSYGMEMAMPYSYRECIVCAPGVPGKSGADGEPGLKGKPGHVGYPGFPGKAGLYGPPGPPGDVGEPGKPGNEGFPGHPGSNGRGGRGLPGPPGRVGRPGAPGHAGRHGARGQDGTPGPQGPSGFAGRDGDPGANGADGAPGTVGRPGDDALYCPCPRRVKEPAVDFEAVMAAYANAGVDAPAQEPPPSYTESRPSERPAHHESAAAAKGRGQQPKQLVHNPAPYEQPPRQAPRKGTKQNPSTHHNSKGQSTHGQSDERGYEQKPAAQGYERAEPQQEQNPGKPVYQQTSTAPQNPAYQPATAAQGYEQSVQPVGPSYAAAPAYEQPVVKQESSNNIDNANEYMRIRMEAPYTAPVHNMNQQSYSKHQENRGYEPYPEPPVMNIMTGY